MIMKRALAWFVFAFWAPLSWAASPYIVGDKVKADTLDSAMAIVRGKLDAVGLKVIGEHRPMGVDKWATVVATDDRILKVIAAIGGDSIVGAAVRVGVSANGDVSYINPDYWYRAFFRDKFGIAKGAVAELQKKLAKGLGAHQEVGGDVPAEELPTYHYMIGMERFISDKNRLRTFSSFDEAVRTVRENLANQVGDTQYVYEVVMPDQKIAVFGVGMNDIEYGEGWWVNKIGPENIAALPYELYIVDNSAYSLYARYRIALGWPNLGMGSFMRIVEAPDAILKTMVLLCGTRKSN
jgi:hypothetical protein